jgi:hypothetical protein
MEHEWVVWSIADDLTVTVNDNKRGGHAILRLGSIRWSDFFPESSMGWCAIQIVMVRRFSFSFARFLLADLPSNRRRWQPCLSSLSVISDSQ